MRRSVLLVALVLLAGLLALSACTPMSNKPYTVMYPEYRGVSRVAVFLQRWPMYRRLKGQGEMQLEFITNTTPFFNAWEPADRLPPRAVDVQDIDDALMGELLLEGLRNKGYKPFIAEMIAPGKVTVAQVMAHYQTLDPSVDAFLFCFYAPTLYYSSPERTPPDRGNRSYYLTEIIHSLNPGESRVMWAGPRAGRSRPDSISHAFVYLTITMFKAADHLRLWAVSGSQVEGRPRPMVWDCPPEPTDADYWADVTIIRRLMANNVRCRLRRLIPEAF